MLKLALAYVSTIFDFEPICTIDINLKRKKVSILVPAPTRQPILAEQHIKQILKDMPLYVVEYLRSKKRTTHSVRS